MIDIQVLIARLQATTSYTIELSRNKEPEMQDLTNLPIIYIGYFSIDSKNPSQAIEYDFLNKHGEDLVQSFDITIVCEPAALYTIWRNIYTALVNYTPTLSNTSTAAVSSFTYAQGGTIGLSNGKLWWLDRWRIGFPTTNVLL